MIVGEVYNLSATVSPNNATNKTITWSSSNANVATVNSSGMVTAVSAGTAVIQVTSATGSNIKSTCSVYVGKKEEPFVLSKTSINMVSGDSYRLTTVPYLSNLIWESSNSTVARVSDDGLITSFAEGTARITAKTSSGNNSASVNVTVTKQTIKMQIGDALVFPRARIGEGSIEEINGGSGLVEILDDEKLLIAINEGSTSIRVTGIGYKEYYDYKIIVEKQSVVTAQQLINLNLVYNSELRHDQPITYNNLLTNSRLANDLYGFYMTYIYRRVKDIPIDWEGQIPANITFEFNEETMSLEDGGFLKWLDITYGWLRPEINKEERIHTLLDLLGIIPFVGVIADGYNSYLYYTEDNIIEALIYGGWAVFSTVVEIGAAVKAVKMLKSTRTAISLLDDSVDWARGAKQSIKYIDDTVDSDIVTINLKKYGYILDIEKGTRPDPVTYLGTDYVNRHLAEFQNGVTKIIARVPEGTIGGETGVFVFPKNLIDSLILKSKGDVNELEKLLGLDIGYFGNNPVRVDIPSPSGLRIPCGNEAGVNSFWIPGGYTSGGVKEAVIDAVRESDYNYKYIFR